MPILQLNNAKKLAQIKIELGDSLVKLDKVDETNFNSKFDEIVDKL